MNKIKKVLSMVLVCVMTLAILPVVSPTEVSAQATGTTALFNGNATYLLQERFATLATLDGDSTRILSGWDIDYRGGDITSAQGASGAVIFDSNTYEKVTMNHKLMKHTGALTFESVFSFKTPADEGFYYEVAGGSNIALRVETARQTAGGKNCVFVVNGTRTNIVPEQNAEYHLKAEFTGSTVTAWINGEKVLNNAAYMNSTSYIDNVEIGTGEAGIGKIFIKNVYVYVNYSVNESFLGKDVADWWTAANGSVVTVPGAPYSADTYGFALNPTEAVEQKYTKDDARVRIVADKSTDYTWTGSNAVVLTDNQTIGGRSGVVKATGLGDGNSTTVGVVLGENFAFSEGDVLTYSFDVYSETAGNANVWLRSHGSELNPFARTYHSVAAATWTNITKTLTFAELEALIATAGSSGSFTTASKYALYIRPTVSTLYLDNFKVTVMRENGEYYSNVATGEWIKMNETMDAPTSNVLWGSNMTSSYADGVLSSTYSTASSNNSIVAVRVVDANGIPVTTIPAGSVIDVSVDVHSSVALSTQAGSTQGIMIRGGTMTNGGSGPSTTGITQLGVLTAAANTWTTQKATYTVTADMTVSGAWYIFLRPQQAGTLKVDNFNITIRNLEAALMASTWEAQKASDITWTGASSAATVSDATDPSSEGRGTVIKATGFNGNNGNVGFVLGNPYQFKAGDIFSYSVDVYTETSSIKPNVWLRDSGDNNPYHTFSNAAPTAGRWTTYTGTMTYDQLVSSSTSADKSWDTAGKFCVYIRTDGGSSTSVLYLDNFKVEVFNPSQHVIDLVDGARYKASATTASGFTWKGGNSVTVTENQTAGGVSGVVKVSGLSNSNTNTLGIKLGDNFRLYEGESFTYTMEVYSENKFSPDVWLRNHSDTTNGAYKTFYNSDKAGGTWHTITKTITYEELNNTSDNKASKGDAWLSFGTQAQYALYLRPRTTSDIYIKNFSVSVVRPEYAYGELPSNASLEKKFASALSGSQTLEFDVLVPNGGANGFAAKLGGAIFKIDGGKFYIGTREIYTPTENVWYNIKVVTNGTTADVSVNGTEKATGVAATGEMKSVVFENSSGKQILIDNVQVGPTFEASDFADYPTLDEADIAKPSGDLSLGMVSYPMWREGNHYGWDLITPYENRVPTLGYYSGGSPEVADWNIKWWAEHGFDHVVYPFVRPDINEAGGQPSFSVRGEELHDGYMNASYKDNVDFAIMLTNPLESQFTDAEGNVTNAQEWINNVLPFITEHYFKNPNYKVLDNQFVVYNYNIAGFRNYLHIEEPAATEGGTPTVIQDGTTELIAILTALNDRAKELGKAGIMFVTDRTSIKEKDLNSITTAITNAGAVQTLYIWRYSWNSDVVTNITNGITNDYNNNNNSVASIPMGFENIPWAYNEIGMIEPSGIETICNTVKSKWNSAEPKLVLFTCWDEWGEGHFFSPSSKSGFDYLNVVRKTLTDKGAALASEDTPTDSAKLRMSVLYPEDRQMLKVRQDKKEALDPAIFTNEAGTLTPSRSNYEDRSGCEISGSWLSKDYTTYNVTSASQAAVWFDAPSGIDYSKVTAIKVVGYAQNSASLVVKYGFSGSDTFGDESHDNRFRFSCANPSPVGTTSGEYILTPNYPNKIQEASNVKYIRFNTQQNTSDGGTFHIEKIVFYTDEVPSQGVSVTVDDAMYTLTSKSIEGTSGTTMIPAYKALLDTGVKVTWDKNTKTLTAVKNGVTAIYKDGVRDVVDENNAVIATAPQDAAHKYQDGNLFIAYDVLLAPFGYTHTVDGDNIYYYSADYNKLYTTTDYEWEFDKAGDREGWSLVDGDKTRYFTEGGYAATVKDGVMHLRAAGTDLNLWLTDANVTKADVGYFSINIDTDATQMYLRLYDSGSYASGAGWTHIINIPDVDGPQDIVVDLSVATDRNDNAFDTMGDTITKVRIDPMYSKTGSAKVDYIRFTEDYPDPFKFKAYSFGDNIFADYSAAYWVYSGLYDKNSSTTGGWGNHPTIVTDGEYSNVLEFKPSEGQTHGFGGITWLTSGVTLEENVTGKKVRVSFDYKAQGDAYQFRFENRDTTNGRDGEEFIVAATNEWQHFDGYINMDETEGSGRRTYAIRAFRNSTSGDGAILIKDWQIRVLNEDTEVSMFTDSGVAIKVLDASGKMFTNNTKVHVSAYDESDKVLTGFTSGNTPNEITVNTSDTTKTEISPYYYMAPTDETDEIRTYLWEGLENLTQPFILQKAN